MECVKKELDEECNVNENSYESLILTDTICYAYLEGNDYIYREILFVYDMQLSTSFIPKNNDNEVERFYLMNIEKVIKKINLRKKSIF